MNKSVTKRVRAVFVTLFVFLQIMHFLIGLIMLKYIYTYSYHYINPVLI